MRGGPARYCLSRWEMAGEAEAGRQIFRGRGKEHSAGRPVRQSVSRTLAKSRLRAQRVRQV